MGEGAWEPAGGGGIGAVLGYAPEDDVRGEEVGWNPVGKPPPPSRKT